MPIARGMAAQRGLGAGAGFFEGLSRGIREEKERRDKKDTQLLEAMQMLERIEKTGEVQRRTARAAREEKREERLKFPTAAQKRERIELGEIERIRKKRETGVELTPAEEFMFTGYKAPAPTQWDFMLGRGRGLGGETGQRFGVGTGLVGRVGGGIGRGGILPRQPQPSPELIPGEVYENAQGRRQRYNADGSWSNP